MTREEAWALLHEPRDLSYSDVDLIFHAFGFTSDTPNHETDIYYHERFKTCGGFTSRDDGLHVVSPMERDLITRMIRCVQFREAFDTGR